MKNDKIIMIGNDKPMMKRTEGVSGTIIPRIKSQGNALCSGKNINNMIRGKGGVMGKEAKAQAKFS